MRTMLILLGCSLSPALSQAPPSPPVTLSAAPASDHAPIIVALSDLKVRFRPTVPVYPPLARLAKIQGTVTLRLTVDVLGRPWKVEGVEGPSALYPAGVAFAKQWLFEPVEKDGRSVPVETQMRVAFRLEDVSATDQPIPPVELSVESPGGAPLVPIDLAVVRKIATETLAAQGFPVLAEAKAAPEGALSLLLRVRTFKTAQGNVIYELLGRLSLLKDHKVVDNEPGKPQQVWVVGRVFGQKGEGGLENRVAGHVGRILGELGAPRLPPDVRAREEKALTEIMSKPTEFKGPAGPPVVQFDFSQIRVKRQPPAPPYPSSAKANRIQGTAIVVLDIDPEGHPISAEALEGPPELLLTALDYALQWEFEPARLNGKALYARFKLNMPFRLR